MKKVLIIGSVKLPVPAVNGGAVPVLIEELIAQQQIEGKLHLTVCSLWNERAVEESKKYSKTDFIWAKVPKIVLAMDNMNRWILKNIIRKDRVLSLGFVFQILWFILFVSGVLAKNDYDMVVFENSIQMLSALRFWGNRKRYNGKYYVHMHAIPRKFVGGKKEFENAAGIICVSRFIADYILNDPQTSVDPSKIRILYNCIDTEAFHPHIDHEETKAIKTEFGIPDNKRLIVFVGRICREKGIEVVLDAVRALKTEDAMLVIVGANFYNSGLVSAYEEHLQKVAEDIKDRLIFTGYVDYTRLPLIYSIADVVVLPSLCEEGAGMTVIESMACGKALITTPSGGIPEYVSKDSCVMVQRDESMAENIALEIDRILSDDNYRNSLETNGSKQAEKYNVAFYYRQFSEIVENHRS